MGGGKDLKIHQVAAIAFLVKAGKSYKEIFYICGISLRSIQQWASKTRHSESGDPPPHKKRSGKPRTTSKRTLRIIQRQVEVQPRITAKEIK